ncbi:hypothetical protein ZWY2020_051965 [Hordeum vulgare]|nr:hypothetical protein ZWY2020_051965 [Hordeum vulgare]
MALLRPRLVAALLALCACACGMARPAAAANVSITTCRSFCGNITVDYPFALHPGCGHAGFRDLLYCIDRTLMLHLPSGSYRVLDIDYAYRGLTCTTQPCPTAAPSTAPRAAAATGSSSSRGARRSWPRTRTTCSSCSAAAPLAALQGFPDQHLPCRNGVRDGVRRLLRLPAWDDYGRRPSGAAYGSAVPPECCAVSWGAIRAVNVSRLQCEGTAARTASRRCAPRGRRVGVRHPGGVGAAGGEPGFCGACRATGRACGHDVGSRGDLCLCGDWNSTSNCDSSADALAVKRRGTWCRHCRSSLGRSRLRIVVRINSEHVRGWIFDRLHVSSNSDDRRALRAAMISSAVWCTAVILCVDKQ